MKKYILLILIISSLAFTFTGNPAGGWYQQFLPDLGGRSIQDIFFLDSLTGWAVTNATNQNPDTTYVLKTTNAGDNWLIQYAKIQTGGGFPGYFRVYFLDENTGYTCGVKGVDKTTDGGTSWISLNAPLNSYLDMCVLNENTIWSVSTNSLTGGVFRTTNGGINWTQQLNLGNLNPDKIYMYNGSIGFIGLNGGQRYVRKTTDGGSTWNVIVTNDYFMDIYFADSMTGWKNSAFGMKKTTNGGINWITQTMPEGGIIQSSFIYSFSNISRDTLWGTGGYVLYPNNQIRGLLYRTTNGGENWLAQIPDTNIHIGGYNFMRYVNNTCGWVYRNSPTGIHTKVGGDTIFLSVKQIGSEVPTDFLLYQNYPNPFNPYTKIKYRISKFGQVKLSVYDISGREIGELVNQEQNIGTYEYTLDGSDLSSGLYFYRLTVNGKFIETKKMILVK